MLLWTFSVQSLKTDGGEFQIRAADFPLHVEYKFQTSNTWNGRTDHPLKLQTEPRETSWILTCRIRNGECLTLWCFISTNIMSRGSSVYKSCAGTNTHMCQLPLRGGWIMTVQKANLSDGTDSLLWRLCLCSAAIILLRNSPSIPPCTLTNGLSVVFDYFHAYTVWNEAN